MTRTAMVIAILLAASACSNTSGEEPTAAGAPLRLDRGTQVIEATPAPGSLLFMSKRALQAQPLDGGEAVTLGTLESPDVFGASGGDWLAEVVARGAASADEDFVARPELRLIDLDSGLEHRVGDGFAPFFAPDGGALVYLKPVGDRACDAEVCRGDSELVLIDLDSSTTRTLLPPGRYNVLSWAGDAVLYADADEGGPAFSVTLDGTVERLAEAPSAIWGAAPDGATTVVVAPDETVLAAGTGAETAIDARGAVLGDGSFSNDSATLGVILLTTNRPVPRARLALIDVADGAVTEVPVGTAASGPVLWSPDGTELVATRAVAGGSRQEALGCEVATLSCEPLFSWGTGISLIAVL